jgi:thioredoxin 1
MKLLKPLVLTTFIFGLIAGACSQSTESLNVDEFEKKLNSGENVQLVDVRTPGEYDKAHINGAQNIDYNAPEFKDNIKGLDKNRPVLVYCLSGGRSAKAASYLRKQGYNTFQLDGGMLKWNEKKKPVVGYGASQGMSSPDFNHIVTNDKLVLVDFHAKWCAPCKVMAPDLEALKVQYADKMVLLKIDADTNSYVVDSLKIQALPTLQLYKGGVQVWNHTGLLSKTEIEKSILEKLSN